MEEARRSSRKKVVLIVILLAALFLCAAVYYWFVIIPGNRADSSAKAYKLSLVQNKPGILQEQLIGDLQSGVNDKYTKSAAYFVMHRYFDNGGDIYEVYKYVNAHPELSFLKEAESLYPKTFKRIQDGLAPSTYSDTGMYAYMAYVAVLWKYGYADVAALSTAANQYAKLAYAAKMAMQAKPKAAPVPDSYQYVDFDIRHSVSFAKKAEGDVVKILKNGITSGDIPARDILVGLNQYASAIRYLKALGADYTAPVSAKDIFAFSIDYAYRNVKELYLFTSLSDATSLTLDSSSTAAEIQQALFPILDYAASTNKPTGIMEKIVNARLEKEPQTAAEIDFDIYGRRNVVMLGEKVPEFKSWLMKNGWQESDFVILPLK